MEEKDVNNNEEKNINSDDNSKEEVINNDNCEKSSIKENYDSSSIKLIEIENKNNIFDNKTIRDQL